LLFAVGVGGGWNLTPLALGRQTVNVCLGASAFDAPTDLVLGPATNIQLCPPPDDGTAGPSVVVSHVSIAPDVQGACPLPGTVPNGDFEQGAHGWTIKPGGVDAVGEVAPGLGEGGSAAAHLAVAHSCNHPALSESISLPSAAMLPNPALRVWSNGSSNAVASIRLGSVVPGDSTGATFLPGRGAPVAANVCIPRWAQGTVQALQLALVSEHFTEDCVDDDARDFVFDGLSFVSEPACDLSKGVFDPGFEQLVTDPGVAPFWALERFDDTPESNVELVTDAGAAHTGAVSARFSSSSPCPHASLSGSVTVPAPVDGAGPALFFFFETNTSTRTSLSVTMNAFALLPVQELLAPTWNRAKICLDPHLAGRPEILRFSVTDAEGGECANGFPEETVGLDDIVLGTDPGCPAM
jgi:hypothetical protein